MQVSEKKKIAIITGASAGLGKEFAQKIEQNYFLDEIWLIARREAPLQELTNGFHKSKGIVLAFDLTSHDDIKKLNSRLQEEQPEISLLINNAGYGKIGPFEKLGLDEQLCMIDLNVRTLTELSYLCLPYMKNGSSILQIASSIAFSPAPYFAVYAATKSYVLSFSTALNYELKERGIHVLAVCPGPVETEFFSVAQKNKYQGDKKADEKPFNQKIMAQAKDVVSLALKDLERKKLVSIYGFPIKFFTAAIPFIPTALAMKLLAKGRKKEL